MLAFPPFGPLQSCTYDVGGFRGKNAAAPLKHCSQAMVFGHPEGFRGRNAASLHGHLRLRMARRAFRIRWPYSGKAWPVGSGR